ncbi:hypothetical protein GBF38_022318, partial [Nibea albiflora]
AVSGSCLSYCSSTVIFETCCKHAPVYLQLITEPSQHVLQTGMAESRAAGTEGFQPGIQK